MVKKVVILLILATIIGCSGEKKQNTYNSKREYKNSKKYKVGRKNYS